MNKIDYDFIEVGTSCFDAMIERATTEHGISVEPLGFYLDMLPDKPNVKKVAAALVSDEEFARSGGTLLTYFVDNNTIIRHNLGGWMLGCNSVGRPHDFHTRWCSPEYHLRMHDPDIPTRNLVEEGLVQVIPTKCYTYAQLVQEFNVGSVRYLKLDTEGNDAVILNSILNYYAATDLSLLPKIIKFEHNLHNKQDDIVAIKSRLVSLGYAIENDLHNATATLQLTNKTRMKIGILLNGVSLGNPGKSGRDWRLAKDQIMRTVINPFKGDHEVHVYASTYKHDTIDDLVSFFSIKKIMLHEFEGSHQRTTLLTALQGMREENLDFIITSRFDTSFYRKLTDFRIDFNKFNFLFREVEPWWSSENFVSDNMFCFPKKYIDAIITALEQEHANPTRSWCSDFHAAYKRISNILGVHNTNFMIDDCHDSTSNNIYKLEYKKMKWEQDLIRDIRTHSWYDDVDGPAIGLAPFEISDCNLKAVQDRFLPMRDRCHAILEIGVHRNSHRSIGEIFFSNKLDSTIYVGIDIDDKSYLNNPAKNIFTIQADSSNIESNMQLIKSLGVRHFDFIFIDGWHSINQCLRDWEYTSMLADDGIVGFHDTRIHPGPHRFMTSLKTQVWHVEENVCRYGEDWGIGFARKLKIS